MLLNRGKVNTMTKKFNTEQIREFWTRQALKHKQSPEASWSDKMAIEMETLEITRRLANGDRVLDVGCANGYSTVQFALHKQITIKGIDVTPGMIEMASLRLSGLANKLLGKVEFAVGDLLNLNEPAEAYGKVVAIRVLINLCDWQQQLRGLHECIRVLKPGGMFLLSEATLQGWRQLNKFRREWNLADIPMPPFNRYLDQEQVIEAVSPHLQLVEIANFSSTYYVATRVLKPLLIRALGENISAADPDMEWNRWFAQLPPWGDYGTQKLFVFRKK